MSKRQLYHKDGRPVEKGDTVTSFRGEKWIVTGWPVNGRNRVFVRDPAGDTYAHEFFPSVFDLTWEKP